jgi:DNA polymerase-3 subunit delta'
MFTEAVNSSYIFIVNEIDTALSELLTHYSTHQTRVIKNDEKDEFQITQANLAIKESYIATNEKKFIFLCGSTFRKEAQNSLLKVLEEPPRNIVFIILTSSKTSILPTIYSRIPYKNLKHSSLKEESSLDIKRLDLKEIYLFLKENEKINKLEAKNLIETILLKVKAQNIKLYENQLQLFSRSLKLIDLNSRPINVLTVLLLSLEKKTI